jgi:adenosylhomocysteine nucleosidase
MRLVSEACHPARDFQMLIQIGERRDLLSQKRIAAHHVRLEYSVGKAAMTFLLLLLCFTTSFSQREFRPITGILGAFDAEVEYLLSIATDKTEKTIQQVRFTEATLEGKKVVIAQTGIGKVNAAITTTLMIEHYMPREIIFTGIAGGTNPGLSPGDIVIGTRIAYHDYGTLTVDSLEVRPTKNAITGKENPLYYNSDKKLVDIAVRASAEVKLDKVKTDGVERYPKIITGTIVTGDVFVSSPKAVKEFRRRFSADATEMEGAAVAQVCLQQSQPFIVVRSLSDNAGHGSMKEVELFYKLAAENSANLVLAIIKLL